MAIAETTNSQAAPPSVPQKAIRVVEDRGPLAHLMDTARFEHLQRIALIMANASLIPDHLKGKNAQQTLGNCFLVVNQALRWGLDPFSVAAETYAVSGKLGFQGKLIAALVNARANLVGNLRYEFKGSGDNRTVTVIGRFSDEDEERTVDLSVAQAKTGNKMWSTDPDQKLIYSASTKWARRHCPEVLLGVLTDDDIDRIAENQQIVEGPAHEAPQSISDLTETLKAATPNTVADHSGIVTSEAGQETVESSSSDAESAEQGETSDVWADHLTAYGAKLDAAVEQGSVMNAEKARDWAMAEYADIPADTVLKIQEMRDKAIQEIRSKRGEKSNPAK